jgi:hypothetical protein
MPAYPTGGIPEQTQTDIGPAHVHATPGTGRAFWVIVPGLITTMLVLFAHWALEANADFNPMGFYVQFVIPIGALIVGLAAGTGYAIGARLAGVKVRRGLLALVLLLLLVCYAASHYVQYLATIPPVLRGEISFPRYFHQVTMSMSWRDKKTGDAGKPLEGWGYLVRFGELVAFIGGGLIPIAVVGGGAYCEACRRYMKKKHLTSFAASVKAQKIKKGDADAAAAHEKEQQDAAEVAEAMLARLREIAAAGDVAEFRQKLDALNPGQKDAGKLPRRVEVQVVYCDRCFAGRLEPTVVTGAGENQTRAALEHQALAPAFVSGITQS